jgi:transcription antitermination protein NusB
MISDLTRAAMALVPNELRAARRFAVQFLYQLDSSQQMFLSDGLLDAFCNQNEVPQEQRLFIRTVVEVCLAEKQTIDNLIETSAVNWKLSRIARVDLAILRICTAELMTRTEVAKDVIIFEGIEIGKEFGSSASGSFINGVLDRIARSTQAKGQDELDAGR